MFKVKVNPKKSAGNFNGNNIELIAGDTHPYFQSSITEAIAISHDRHIGDMLL